MKKCVFLAFALIFGVGNIFAQGEWTQNGFISAEQARDTKAEIATIFALGIPVIFRNCVSDRQGDVYSSNPVNVVDLVELCAGTNGSVTTLKMTFTMAADVRGRIYLDTDRDGSTGKNLYNIQPRKSFGYEYVLNLDDLVSDNIVRILNASGEEVGSFQAMMDGNVLELEVPLSPIKSNGSMNIAVDLRGEDGISEMLDVPFISVFAVETGIFPKGGRFVEGQSLEILTFTNASPGIYVERIRIFINGQSVGAWAGKKLPFKTSSGRRDWPVGKYKASVVTETNIGTFSDEVIFEVIPSEKAIPQSSEIPVISTPVPTVGGKG